MPPMPKTFSHARLLILLVPLLTGCELDFNSNSGDGSKLVLSSTNTPQLITSAESENARIRFNSTGL